MQADVQRNVEPAGAHRARREVGRAVDARGRLARAGPGAHRSRRSRARPRTDASAPSEQARVQARENRQSARICQQEAQRHRSAEAGRFPSFDRRATGRRRDGSCAAHCVVPVASAGWPRYRRRRLPFRIASVPSMNPASMSSPEPRGASRARASRRRGLRRIGRDRVLARGGAVDRERPAGRSATTRWSRTCSTASHSVRAPAMSNGCDASASTRTSTSSCIPNASRSATRLPGAARCARRRSGCRPAR